MQTLNFTKSTNLNNALNSSEVLEIKGENVVKQVLRSGKHLSGDSYLKLMGVKKKFRDAFTDIQEKEKDVFEHNDYILVGGQWVPPVIDDKDKEAVKKQRENHKEISKKLDAIHNEVSIDIIDPFIKREEFLEWTKECSNEAASVLAEFLLVDFNKQ